MNKKEEILSEFNYLTSKRMTNLRVMQEQFPAPRHEAAITKAKEIHNAIRSLIEKFFEWQGYTNLIKIERDEDGNGYWKAGEDESMDIIEEIRDFGHEVEEKKEG